MMFVSLKFDEEENWCGIMESLEGERKGSYSLRVSANYRLIVKPMARDLSAESLKICDTLIIEGVIDYHGKGKNAVGLSRDYIIHPGETLAEVIEDREMTQRELAVRTGMTEKHISTVIHGQKSISAAFAKKLEYALGIEASFWMNLQADYDRELLEFEEVNNLTEEELGVLKNLKDVIEVWTAFGWLDSEANAPAMVLDLRRLFGISNLLDTPKISYAAAYRAQSKNANVDPYVLFAWQRMCELLTKNIEIADRVDVEKLRNKIPAIKQVMFMKANQIQKKLSDIFAECGIAFRIVPNFTGAPVQGFI